MKNLKDPDVILNMYLDVRMINTVQKPYNSECKNMFQTCSHEATFPPCYLYKDNHFSLSFMLSRV
jgi:hypothetical protein